MKTFENVGKQLLGRLWPTNVFRKMSWSNDLCPIGVLCDVRQCTVIGLSNMK